MFGRIDEREDNVSLLASVEFSCLMYPHLGYIISEKETNKTTKVQPKFHNNRSELLSTLVKEYLHSHQMNFELYRRSVVFRFDDVMIAALNSMESSAPVSHTPNIASNVPYSTNCSTAKQFFFSCSYM